MSTRTTLAPAGPGGLQGVIGNGRGVTPWAVGDHIHAHPLAPGLELLDGRGAEGIGGRQKDAVPLLFEVVGQLGYAGCLAHSVDPHDEDDQRPA